MEYISPSTLSVTLELRYQPPNTATPTTKPPRTLSNLPRKSVDLNTNASRIKPKTRPITRSAVAAALLPATIAPRSCPVLSVIAMGRIQLKNNTDIRVWSVPGKGYIIKYDTIAIMANTISDFKLPPPSLTRVLLPQPLASVMPIPNRTPPRIFSAQIT